MSDIQNIYTNAELALAAYASLESNSLTSSTSNIEALIDAGFSAEQAKEFAKQYPVVVEQYNDTDNSFSATVFKDAEGNLTTNCNFSESEQRKAA